MHVWIVATYEPLPEIDASSRLLRCGMLAARLRADGDDVTWWTSTFHHVRKENRFETSRSFRSESGVRLELLHAPPYRRNVSWRRVAHNRAMARAFTRHARRNEERPDVIFAAVPSLELAESAVRYAHSIGVPIVVDARDKWPDIYLSAIPTALRGVARRVLDAEFERARRIFRGADGVTAISEDYLTWALAYAGRERRLDDAVAPLGFPIPDEGTIGDREARMARLRQTLGLHADKSLVTFLGMFGHSYDLECVVAAARQLHEAGRRDVAFVLAGTGETERRVRLLSVGLPNVHFTGWLDQRDAWALLRASSLGLAPYRDLATQSLPNKAFEYMAAGLPVVSSLVGELSDLLEVEGVGETYTAGDPKALADAVRRLVDSPARGDMAARARALYAERYSTDAIYSALAEHLRDVGGRRRSRSTLDGPVGEPVAHGGGR